jgi:nucleoside-diphosphate-sugar epimerase
MQIWVDADALVDVDAGVAGQRMPQHRDTESICVRLRRHDVVGMDSDLYSRCTFSAGGTAYEVPTIRKDTRDASLDDLTGFDGVIHLAALSNDPLSNLKPSLTDDINHRASVRIAELAKQAGARRFVFASSCSNYGKAGEDMIDESGLSAPEDSVLPGPIKLHSKASVVYKRAMDETYAGDRSVGLLSACAIAASEENARGHLVITAPTGGSAGVIVSASRRFECNHGIGSRR